MYFYNKVFCNNISNLHNLIYLEATIWFIIINIYKFEFKLNKKFYEIKNKPDFKFKIKIVILL